MIRKYGLHGRSKLLVALLACITALAAAVPGGIAAAAGGGIARKLGLLAPSYAAAAASTDAQYRGDTGSGKADQALGCDSAGAGAPAKQAAQWQSVPRGGGGGGGSGGDPGVRSAASDGSGLPDVAQPVTVTTTVPRRKKRPGLLERASFGGWQTTFLGDCESAGLQAQCGECALPRRPPRVRGAPESGMRAVAATWRTCKFTPATPASPHPTHNAPDTFEVNVGSENIAEADPVVAATGLAAQAGIGASYLADYDYERTSVGAASAHSGVRMWIHLWSKGLAAP